MNLLGNIVNPSVLIIGVFHGDEPQGEFLINEYLKNKKETNLLFIPRLNATSKRVNENGVDLNRNFPTKNWVLSNKDDYFGGNSPASEKETKFIINVVDKYKPKIILTLHAPYKIVNFDGPKIPLIDQISAIMNYPVKESIGYPTPGSFGTWAGIEKNITTVTLELDEKMDNLMLFNKVRKVFELMESI